MVEEQFKKDEDDEDDIIGVPARDSTIDNQSEDEAEIQKSAQTFVKEDRISAFHDLVYINKFARNCPATS